MNTVLLIALAISALAVVSANYNQPKIQNLLYRPPPRPRPLPPMRVRRQLTVAVKTDPREANAHNHNLIAKPGGANTKGVEFDYNL